HSQTRGREDIAKVLDRVLMELTLFRFGIQAVVAQVAKYLFYMFSVMGIDKDVIEVDHNTDI
ncbi:hypothetical protein PISMIDRAFT_96649, partial [Pisolithus microcarpus 441]